MKSIELGLRHLKSPNFGKVPEQPNQGVLQLAAPHIDSFNFFLEEGKFAFESIPPLEFATSRGDKVSITYQNIEIGKPRLPAHLSNSADTNLYPKECIERGCSYKSNLIASVVFMVNRRMLAPLTISLGEIPIMVKSKNCHLAYMTPEQLVKHGELVNETGGYFIINGGCRVLRMLIANRRNYPIALVRPTFKKRDNNFSDKGILMRCVGEDQGNAINVVHHLTTGGVKFSFQISKDIFLVPLVMIMKALLNYSDHLIYQHLIRCREKDNYYSEKIKMMLRELQEKKLITSKACREYIGSRFRHKLHGIVPDWYSNEEACEHLMNKYVLIHLKSAKLKFESLCMMTRKLYAFVQNEVASEGVDVMSMQEVSLPGHTYLQVVKEKLMNSLVSMKYTILLKDKELGDNYYVTDAEINNAVMKATKIGDVIQTFLATGSLPAKTHCGLMQDKGLTVMYDHLNRMRDLSHLRAIHRGAYFLDMKTIEPRRLTGEAWGFICPVHTPDGAPCGLLNHLAYDCVIPCNLPKSPGQIINCLVELGMSGTDCEPSAPFSECLEVIVDGGLVGYVPKNYAESITFKLRYLKVSNKIYKYTEIVLIPEKENQAQYPGLFIITSPARMMRPVINIYFGLTEFVGTLEQLYLNVAIDADDIEEGVHTHMELSKTSILSNIGKLVPFSDCNPNPRNMYQCQMGKQTMGTPIHNWKSQTFNKLYRLQYPQVPLVRNSHYDKINMEEFCMGFNAVLAIVSYTGFDMEDAMVINKCAMERGLAHGWVYKSEFVDLAVRTGKKHKINSEVNLEFRRDPVNLSLKDFLDEFGLPFPGTKLKAGDPYYCVYDVHEHSYSVTKYKGEDCVIDKYTIINSGKIKPQPIQRVNITIRIRRDPIIGDKFASRSGQKGILSRLYPMVDLPFSERGIVPDIIFNPHGIPSRMTAGTLIEMVAGKCAAEFAKSFDSAPFQFDDKNPAYDYFGKILEKAGFNYYGEDVLYSGTDGRMMDVHIFEGILYYQRLRHMTADKWQVRAGGAVDAITRQPVKGRKRGGAIRFGEMERDCLISHGAPYTLKDRLLDCSDDAVEWVCSKCGSLLSLQVKTVGSHQQFSRLPECSICGPEAQAKVLHIPYAFKYLVAELASVGINTKLTVQGADEIAKLCKYPAVVPAS